MIDGGHKTTHLGQFKLHIVFMQTQICATQRQIKSCDDYSNKIKNYLK